MVKDRDFHYLPFIGNALGYGYVLAARIQDFPMDDYEQG